MLFSTFYHLLKGNFLKSFLTFCILGAGFGIFLIYTVAMFWEDQSLPDHYADKLSIPKNIKIYSPSDTSFSHLDADPNFQLYNSLQPGIYSYALWMRKIEKGYCYLKAFEITQNDPLSADKLKERSKMIIYNQTDAVKMFRIGKDEYNSDRFFTIYEGDWYKPYAARFEVWFVSENGGQERKLMEKNFKIEGWMR